VWPAEEPSAYVWHVLALLAIGSAFAALRRPGPLERVVSLVSGVAADLVRGPVDPSEAAGTRGRTGPG